MLLDLMQFHSRNKRQCIKWCSLVTEHLLYIFTVSESFQKAAGGITHVFFIGNYQFYLYNPDIVSLYAIWKTAFNIKTFSEIKEYSTREWVDAIWTHSELIVHGEALSYRVLKVYLVSIVFKFDNSVLLKARIGDYLLAIIFS